MKKNFIFFLVSLAFFSCQKEENINEDLGIDQDRKTEFQGEVAFPNQRSKTFEGFFNKQKITYERINGFNVIEGDILLSDDDISKTIEKSAIRTDRLWANDTVFYRIDSDLPNKSRVRNAITHWQGSIHSDVLAFVEVNLIDVPPLANNPVLDAIRQLAINFNEVILRAHPGAVNYIDFVEGDGCSSYIGMLGGRQTITLGDNCSTGNTIHEIGHAIGLYHEQSRVDRDQHIKINFQNIEDGKAHNFRTYADRGREGNDILLFDFNSIMMYGPRFFSKNGKPTITKLNGDTYSIQRDRLSGGDAIGALVLYGSN
ncbi:M12 family metallopeptidase [Aquimarina rhabdastrellae]